MFRANTSRAPTFSLSWPVHVHCFVLLNAGFYFPQSALQLQKHFHTHESRLGSRHGVVAVHGGCTARSARGPSSDHTLVCPPDSTLSTGGWTDRAPWAQGQTIIYHYLLGPLLGLQSQLQVSPGQPLRAGSSRHIPVERHLGTLKARPWSQSSCLLKMAALPRERQLSPPHSRDSRSSH